MPVRERITTEDPRAAKRQRVEKALRDPKLREKSNYALARLLGVDESMIRRHRPKKPAKKKTRKK